MFETHLNLIQISKVQYRARSFRHLKKIRKLSSSRKITQTLSITTISETKENYHHARNFHFEFIAFLPYKGPLDFVHSGRNSFLALFLFIVQRI